MTTLFDFIDRPLRTSKTRETGVTSLLDKGLGIESLEGILRSASEYIDLVKFSFGTAIVLPELILKEKILRLEESNCGACLGGTLFEIVEQQNNFDAYLKLCRELKLNFIEISDGAIPIKYERKLDCIKKACDWGFKVLSEIGNKNPDIDRALTVEDRVSMIKAELEAGSWKVIIEARESGTLGLFDSDGQINKQDFFNLIQKIPENKLVFEAPLKQQQAWLINHLGANVNLGNIAPEDVIGLEALRQQLRADTICQS